MMNGPVFYCTIVLTMLFGSAASGEEQRQREGRKGPPPVALEACANASEGEHCSFVGRHDDTISGTCRAMQSQELVCFPEGGPPQRTRNNPPE